MRLLLALCVVLLGGCSVLSDAKDDCSEPLCDGHSIIECQSVRHSGKRMLARVCEDGMTCSAESGTAACVPK
jgi:hypothetical protein